MLTLIGDRGRFCDGLSRRSFLQIGSLAVGGLTLPQLLRAESLSGRGSSHKSVIMVYLSGGLSHQDTFDLKPDAPDGIRGEFQPIDTAVPGIQFGELLPKLSACADKLAVVRSYGSQNANHTYQSVTTAGNALQASVGSIFARVAGANHPRTGMPANILVLPEAVQDGLTLEKKPAIQAYEQRAAAARPWV